MKTLRIVCSTVAFLAAISASSSAADRSYVSGNFMFQLKGENPGSLRSIEGGAIKADVVSFTEGGDLRERKQVAGVKYEDFSMQVDAGQGKGLYDWVSSTVDGEGSSREGAITATDATGKPRQQAQFTGALITEITVPSCDGASKDPAYLAVKFSPETVTWNLPAGAKPITSTARKQKQWLSSNFRLDIKGLDCSRISKIEAFTIKQSLVQHSEGDKRGGIRVPGKIEYPNLVITLPTTSAETWLKWSDDFLIGGHNGDEDEKNGTLSFVSSDLSEELVRVSIDHIGVARVHRSLSDSKNGISTVTVELYVESMAIDFMAQFEK